jgi:hypothetical protein
LPALISRLVLPYSPLHKAFVSLSHVNGARGGECSKNQTVFGLRLRVRVSILQKFKSGNNVSSKRGKISALALEP